MIQIFRPFPLSLRASTGLLILRLVVGLAFMFHGYGKIQNPTAWMGEHASIPAFFQVLAAISEFGGGLAWILGLVTPLASFGIGCTMTVATYMMAIAFHNPFVATAPGKTGFEPPLVYLCVAILFLLSGPGRFSLDQLIFGEKATMESQRAKVPSLDRQQTAEGTGTTAA